MIDYLNGRSALILSRLAAAQLFLAKWVYALDEDLGMRMARGSKSLARKGLMFIQ